MLTLIYKQKKDLHKKRRAEMRAAAKKRTNSTSQQSQAGGRERSESFFTRIQREGFCCWRKPHDELRSGDELDDKNVPVVNEPDDAAPLSDGEVPSAQQFVNGAGGGEFVMSPLSDGEINSPPGNSSGAEFATLNESATQRSEIPPPTPAKENAMAEDGVGASNSSQSPLEDALP